ncbi:MAG: HAD family hydrolase [Bacteroidota bacterium]
MGTPPPACVIFDIDGTLTRTNDLIFASFNHLARQYLGRSYAPAEIVGFFGPPEEGALSKIFGAEEVDRLMDELCEFYESNHASMAEAHSGVREMLTYLKGRGVRLAVFTGKGRRTTTITLEALELSRYFDIIVSGTDVVQHKPHPEGICRVLDRFNVRAEETIMVGDSLSDIKASRAAGVHIASALWDCFDPEGVLSENRSLVFHSVEDLHAWLRDRIQ